MEPTQRKAEDIDWAHCEDFVASSVARLLALADSPVSDWKFTGEKEGVHIYSKFTEGSLNYRLIY